MIKLKARGSFFDISFEDLAPILKSKDAFLILDRDGTLVPIYEHPEQAIINPQTLESINRTARLLDGRMAIVSARSLARLEAEFDSSLMILAGNYGLEIKGPFDWKFLHPIANQSRLEILAARKELEKLVQVHPELILDDHCLTLCLHLHKLPAGDHQTVTAVLTGIRDKYLTLKFRALETSYEVFPLLEWSKSNALDKIEEHHQLQYQNLTYIAFGDSCADESLFAWSNQRFGLSFLVGNRQDTNARGAVADSSKVIEFMDKLCNLLERTNPP